MHNNIQAKQLTLNIQLKDEFSFNNFNTENNLETVSFLKNIETNKEKFIYIWGHKHSGRSHLIQATCQKAKQNNLSIYYLPLKIKNTLSTKILENLENLDLVCFDDIDCIAKDNSWEEVFFYTFNKLLESNTRIIISAKSIPNKIDFSLKDIQSRLNLALIFKINNLTKDAKAEVLSTRAKARGMNLSTSACKYLVNTYFDIKSLLSTLDKLDKISLRDQHKLTIPFIKKHLLPDYLIP